MMIRNALLFAASVFAAPALAQEESGGAPLVAPAPEAQASAAVETGPPPAEPAPVEVKPAPVVVTAGEHGAFSRIVVAGAGAKLAQSGRTLKISLDQAGEADLGALSNRKRAERVTGARLIPGASGNDIVLDLACDCRVTSTRLPNGKFVVDIYDGARPAAPPAQTAANAPARELAAAPQTEVPAGPPKSVPQAARPAASGVHADNILSAGADKLSVGEARKRMIALLQQAADDGIITVKPGSDELTAPAPAEPANSPPGPVTLTRPTAPINASLPAKPTSPAKPKANPAALVDADTDDTTQPASKSADPVAAVTRTQNACLPDAAFTIDGRKFVDSPLEAIAALQKELDDAEVDAKPAIAERLALGYLAIGFGEEALGVLGGIEEQGSLYADMARVAAEKAPRKDGLLMRGADCRGAHALWLAAAAEPQEAAKLAARAGDAINTVPQRLRGALAAHIARTLVAVGDGEAARRYYQIALKASGKTPELKFVEAKLLELQGNGEAAHEIFDVLEHENGKAATDAIGELSERARKGVGEDLGVLAKSARGTPDEGRAALREAAFWADSGAIESGVFLLRDAARRDPAVASDAVRKARETIKTAFASSEPKKRVAALAAYIHDKDFLQSEGGDAEIATLASDAAIEFGVPNAALVILRTPAAAEGLGPARIARAALAADAAEEAVAVAAPFADQPDFAHVLVKANIELGRGYAALAAASALPDSPEKASLTADAAWRAGDYKSAARAFAKVDPASLNAPSAERYGYAAYMAGEPALPAAAEAVLREAKSPALVRLQNLFKPTKSGPIVERGKSAVAGANDDLKFITEVLGG